MSEAQDTLLGAALQWAVALLWQRLTEAGDGSYGELNAQVDGQQRTVIVLKPEEYARLRRGQRRHRIGGRP